MVDEQEMNALRDRLSQEPNNAALHERVYEMLSGPDNVRQMIDFYRQLQRSHPNDWRHLVNLARAYSKAGKDSLAVVQLQKLLRADPSLNEVWMELAACYTRLDKTELALRALNSAIDVDDSKPDAHVQRVLLLTKTEELEEAAAAAVFSLESKGLPGSVVEWLDDMDVYLEAGIKPPDDTLAPPTN